MTEAKWNIGVAQMDCAVGDVDANLAKIAQFARLGHELGLDLMITPECSTTGYFVGESRDELIGPPDGPMTSWLGKIARENGLHLAVGSYTRVGNATRNSQLLLGPNGKLLAVYHKAHLFAAEREVCEPGDEPCVVDTSLGKIGMTICYDLIFPDYVRTLVGRGADFIINSTHWFNDRYQRDVWDWTGRTTQSLASIRALENVTFVAMADRVGRESPAPELDFDALGYSCVAGPSGKILASVPQGEGLAVARIDMPDEELDKWRDVATYRTDRRPELYD